MSSSEDIPSIQGTQGTQETPPQRGSGRTFWDLFYSGRFVILAILIIVGIIGGVGYSVLSGNLDPDDIGPAVSSLIGQSYPAILFFAGGFMLMRHIMFNVYRPASRLVFVTNADDQICGLFRIPETRFRTMNQPGNPLVFKTISGNLIYFARYLDIDNNEIGYGWSHVDKWEIVSADRVLFSKLEKEYQWLLERVMYLEGHLEVESAYKARSPMSKMAEDIASRFGLRKRREHFGFSHSNEVPTEEGEQGDEV